MSKTKRRSSIQVIKDPLLEPFFISKDEYGFSIRQMVQSDASHFRSKGENKVYEKTLYFYPTFNLALNKIALLKSDSTDFNSLQDYLNNYLKISEQIKIYTNGIKSQI